MLLLKKWIHIAVVTVRGRLRLTKKENVAPGHHGGRWQRAGQGHVTLTIDHHGLYGPLSFSCFQDISDVEHEKNIPSVRDTGTYLNNSW